MTQNDAKDAAARKAIDYVQDGMRLGLGTGSTAAFFIQHLIEKCKEGLQVNVAATSVASEKMAHEGGIPLLDISTLSSLDLTVDGADEIDPQMRLIKGAGGALLREKIIASMSHEMIVIADPSKQADVLGRCPLPVEVIPFGSASTQKTIEDLGLSGSWRTSGKKIYKTDNHNLIFDVTLPSPLSSPEEIHAELLLIPGVVETGFFFGLADLIIIGYEDGSSEVLG